MGLDETTQQSERGPLVLEIVLPSGTRVIPLDRSCHEEPPNTTTCTRNAHHERSKDSWLAAVD